jgi:hypothetical protein
MIPRTGHRLAAALLLAALAAAAAAAAERQKFSLAALRATASSSPSPHSTGGRGASIGPAPTSAPLPSSLADIPKNWWGRRVSPPWTARCPAAGRVRWP